MNIIIQRVSEYGFMYGSKLLGCHVCRTKLARKCFSATNLLTKMPRHFCAFIQGPLNGGVSNGGVSRSGFFCPFFVLFCPFLSFFGTFPIFPVFSRFALSRPMKSTYEEQSRKGSATQSGPFPKKVGNTRVWKPPGLASLNLFCGSEIIPQNSCQISRKISLTKNQEKFTDEHL